MSLVLTKAEHEQKAAHNEQFAASATQFPDWAITAYFYAALHWAEAYFHAGGFGFTSHRHRNQAVAAQFPTQERDRYLTLYSYSRLVRYDSVTTDPLLYEDALRQQFQPLKSWLLAQL